MQLNSLIFPAPPSSYSLDTEETIIWIPKKKVLTTSIPLFSGQNENGFLTHKKSASSHNFQGKLLSPKFNFERQFDSGVKTSQKSTNVPDLTRKKLISLENDGLLTRKSLKYFLLKKMKKTQMVDDSSDRTNLESKPSLNRIKIPNAAETLLKLKFTTPLSLDFASESNRQIMHSSTIPHIFGPDEITNPNETLVKNSSFFFTKKRSPSDPSLNGQKSLQQPLNSPKNISFPEKIKFCKLETPKIPCLLIQYPKGSNLIFLHFHGNAEDIGDSLKYMKRFAYELKVNVLLVEYPGYGIYKGSPSSEDIVKDAETIIDYLIYNFCIKPKDIILIGRSIGTGAATHLASCRNVGGLILISGYTSVKAAIKDYAGRVAKLFFEERFENVEKIQKVICPVLIIHGMLDKLIPFRQSIELKSKIKEDVYSEIFLSLGMTHNDFDVENDIIAPISNFLKKAKISIKNGKEEMLKIPEEVNIAPSKRYKKGNSFLNVVYSKIKFTK